MEDEEMKKRRKKRGKETRLDNARLGRVEKRRLDGTWQQPAKQKEKKKGKKPGPLKMSRCQDVKLVFFLFLRKFRIQEALVRRYKSSS